MLRTAASLGLGAVGGHLLVSGLGGLLSLNPLGLLTVPLGAGLLVVAAGLFVEAAIRAVRVAMTRGRARRQPQSTETDAHAAPGDD